MLRVTSILPVGGTRRSPAAIDIPSDINEAYNNPKRILINFEYSNPTDGPVWIFVDAEGQQINTGSPAYDSDNDPITNPGALPKDGFASHYLYRYTPGTVSQIELYIQEITGEGSYGRVVERLAVPGFYTYQAFHERCIEISVEQYKDIMPNVPRSKISQFQPSIENALSEFSINTAKRVQAFIAQIAHESNQLRSMEENLNYSTRGLLKVFPKYFKNKEEAGMFARQPEKIANYVYGGRLGNKEANDGYLYRGRGLIQITGRRNYRKAGEALGVELEANPDLALDPEISARIAGWFWESNGLNGLADSGSLREITKKINGGLNGFAERLKFFERAQRVLACDSGIEAQHFSPKSLRQQHSLAMDPITGFHDSTTRAVRETTGEAPPSGSGTGRAWSHGFDCSADRQGLSGLVGADGFPAHIQEEHIGGRLVESGYVFSSATPEALLAIVS